MSHVAIISGRLNGCMGCNGQGMGFFQSAPDPTNADSIPNTSEFDSQWSCSDWQTWFGANVTKYGQTTAVSKFTNYFNQLSSWNSEYSFCKYDCTWASYFAGYGIDVGDVFSHAECSGVALVNSAGQVVNSAGQALTNIAQGASNTAATLSWLLPVALVTITGIAAYKYFKGQKVGISGKRKKRNHGKRK